MLGCLHGMRICYFQFVAHISVCVSTWESLAQVCKARERKSWLMLATNEYCPRLSRVVGATSHTQKLGKPASKDSCSQDCCTDG
jgi:hypothetical protein